jgi:signal transduction histidine kinase
MKKADSAQKNPRRFALRWQLAIAMAAGFFVIFIIFAIAMLSMYQHFYGTQPDSIKRWILGALILSGLAMFAFAYALAAWLLRPVQSIESTIAAFDDDPMTDVRAESGYLNDELSDLVHLVNRMIDRLQRLITAQQQFVSDVSHELRTPVAIVKGHMGLLNRWGKDDPKVLNDSIVASLAEVQRMETLIGEMLNLSRIDQIEIDNISEQTDVGATVRRVFSNFEMIHPEFRFTLDDDLAQPAFVKMRQDHLEQVLIILADNAVKYSTDRQEVHFALSRSLYQIEIGIQDFGEGLSEENAKRVFDRFYRVDKARSRKKGGNGLGLSIAKRLIEAYRGDITLESSEGFGSIFTIMLPVVRQHED